MDDQNATPEIPYGYCQCGCGEKAPIATQNHTRYGWVKGEPLAFIRGHSARVQPQRPREIDQLEGPLCACGCGERVQLSRGTRGKAKRFIHGHHARLMTGEKSSQWKGGAWVNRKEAPRVQSDHLCACGCQQYTYIATQTDKDRDVKKGDPYRYLPGHQNRGRKRKVEAEPEERRLSEHLCECGCGRMTYMATTKDKRYGYTPGEPLPYLKNHLKNQQMRKRTEGYRFIDKNDGYVRVYMPDHPAASNGYVLEHRLVMEQMISRPLRPEERCHHIDRNKANNHPSNLLLLENAAEHNRLHHRERAQWSQKYEACIACGTTERHHAGKGLCARCYASERSRSVLT